MFLRRKSELRLLAPAADFHICGFVGAIWNIFSRKIGNRSDKGVQFRLQPPLFVFAGLDLILEASHFADQRIGRSVVLARLCLSDQT